MGSIDISFVFSLEKTKKETIVPKKPPVSESLAGTAKNMLTKMAGESYSNKGSQGFTARKARWEAEVTTAVAP